MNLLKESLQRLKGHFWKACLLMLFPIFLTCLIFLLRTLTLSLSIFAISLAMPFFYGAFKYIWDVSNNEYKEGTKYFSFTNYIRNPGAKGCFGVLKPFIIGILVYSFISNLLSTFLLTPLLKMYAGQEFYQEFQTLIEQYTNTVGGSDELFQVTYFIFQNGDKFNGPLTIILNIALFFAFLAFVILFNKPRFNYVLAQKIMPDADLNLIGAQSRLVGKLSSNIVKKKYISARLPSMVIMWSINFLIFIGTTIGFSFIKAKPFYLISAMPSVIFAFLSIPILVISGASDTVIADKLMNEIFESTDQRTMVTIFAMYYDKMYRHRPENANKLPFGGLAHKPNDFSYDDGLFTVEPEETDININVDDEPENIKPFNINDSNENPDSENTQENDSNDDKDFGTFNFSDDDENNEPNN